MIIATLSKVFSKCSCWPYKGTLTPLRFQVIYRITSSAFDTSDYVDIVEKRYRGKLVIIPTPIGNLEDMSVNMYKKLFQVDVIGCEDTRVAGKLYKLLDNKKISAKLYDAFGYGNQILEQQQNKDYIEDPSDKQYLEYQRMNERQRKKFTYKMSRQDQAKFKQNFLVYRAKKILNKYDDLKMKPSQEQYIYGLENPEIEEIEKYIIETRKKKGRGVMISLNTYTETKRFDTILKLLENYKVGIISDAGTPCISDPGSKLVEFIRNRIKSVQIQVIKGPSAVGVMKAAAYLTNPSQKQQRFLSGYFEGFSKSLYNPNNFNFDYDSFIIYFQNARRLGKVLAYIQKLYNPHQKIYVANEISKLYERKFNGKVEQLRELIKTESQQFLGQISYIIYPKLAQKDKFKKKYLYQVNPQAVALILDQQIDLKQKEIAKIMTQIISISKTDAMKHIISMKKYPKKQ